MAGGPFPFAAEHCRACGARLTVVGDEKYCSTPDVTCGPLGMGRRSFCEHCGETVNGATRCRHCDRPPLPDRRTAGRHL